jgi:hypothetical protein
MAPILLIVARAGAAVAVSIAVAISLPMLLPLVAFGIVAAIFAALVLFILYWGFMLSMWGTMVLLFATYTTTGFISWLYRVLRSPGSIPRIYRAARRLTGRALYPMGFAPAPKRHSRRKGLPPLSPDKRQESSAPNSTVRDASIQGAATARIRRDCTRAVPQVSQPCEVEEPEQGRATADDVASILHGACSDALGLD